MLSVAIMAHPKRRRYVKGLQAELPGAKVAWDKQNDRWDTGRRAILSFDPEADWHLIVQDDAVLCSSFLPGVERALASVPCDRPVSFYTGRTRPYANHVSRAVKEAAQRSRTWIEMRGPFWGVAVALPTSLIEQMVAEADGLEIANYDLRMAEWFQAQGIACWYSIPSLVDHRVGPENPSLVPGRGSAPGRTAHAYIGEEDPREVRWSADAYRPGDPTELWHEDGHCGRCAHKFDSLPEVIVHVYTEHDAGPFDFLASNNRHAEMLRRIWDELPNACLGEFYLVGAEASGRVDFPHRRLLRKSARNKLKSRDTFTIVGAGRDLRYLGNRPGWSVVGGESN